VPYFGEADTGQTPNHLTAAGGFMFSEQDISFITENVNKYSNAEIATVLKCKKKQVESWLYKNGVKHQLLSE
jgi:hypothetical protein